MLLLFDFYVLNLTVNALGLRGPNGDLTESTSSELKWQESVEQYAKGNSVSFAIFLDLNIPPNCIVGRFSSLNSNWGKWKCKVL